MENGCLSSLFPATQQRFVSWLVNDFVDYGKLSQLNKPSLWFSGVSSLTIEHGLGRPALP